MRFALSPFESLRSAWRNRDLIRQLTERDTRSRYRGSAGGMFWAVINPLVMLAVYTLFFWDVFPAKWATAGGSHADFALILYVGLMLHGFVAEMITRAPSLVVGQPNLVRKVVFPLEVLPIVALGSALFHLCISFSVWLVFFVVLRGAPPLTAFFFPVIVLPLAMFALGLCWFVAALAVYLRDVTHIMPMVATVLMFASPIFYPLSALSPGAARFVALGPLAIPVEMSRAALLSGIAPDPWLLGGYLLLAGCVAALGFAWFQATRKGFADVL